MNASRIPLFLILVIIGLSFYLGAGFSTSNTASLSQTALTPITVDTSKTTGSTGQNLQIQTIQSTSSPTPAPSSPALPPHVAPSNPCQPDTGEDISGTGCTCDIVDITLTCSGGECVSATSGPSQNANCITYKDGACGSAYAPGDGTYCYAKPVIYLYPTKPTNVSVKIETQGEITISDPLYENGWENVLAFPDGKLIYKNKAYSELFYETDNNKITPPSSGLAVETKNIKDELYDLTKNLGLIKHEQDELVEFWVPRLTALNTKYILISLVDKKTKEKSDNVLITPNPDTKIEFILYFRGIDEKVNIPPLSLPKTPRRVGFTSVEWGGTIDQ